MADILCKLKLVTDNYESNLKKSRQQMQDFEKGIGIARAGVTKFLGVLGAGVTAGEVFNKWMRSSQTTSDEFDNTINAAKGSVDAFFTSLNTGNWDVFSNGIMSAFGKLKDLSALMDTIADMKLSLGYIKAEDLRNIEEYEARARDTTLSLKERKEALESMKTQIKDLNSNTETYIQTSTQGLIDSYKANYGIDITPEELKIFARTTNFSDPEMMDKVEVYKKGLEDLKKSFEVTTSVQSIAGMSTIKTMKPGSDEAIENYKKQNEFIYNQVVLLDEVDERRKAMMGTLVENLGLEQQIESLNKRANRLNNSLSKNKESKDKKDKDKPVEGSIDYINAQISDLTKKLNASTNEATRYGLRKAIEKFNKEKHLIELEATITPLESKKVGKVAGKSAKNAAGEKVSPIANKKLKSTISKKDVKINNDYADSLYAISSMMGSVTDLTNDSATAWASWGSNVLSSIATAIPAITALTTAKKAEATANSEATVTGAMSSVASIPVVGWIMALAAGAAVIASMAAIPKFENGGIVGVNGGIIPGASFSGDKILARVNSGELILNRAQQKNIASQLVAGGSASRIDVNVVGRISGRDLELVQEKRNQFKRRTQ